MVGFLSLQCAVTKTIALGASAVPRPRMLGTFSLIDLINAACPGSPITGMGPPPWHTEIAGARGIVLYEVWLREQMGRLGRRNRLDSSAIDDRFANCMEVLESVSR
jgi:hypothetical protein